MLASNVPLNAEQSKSENARHILYKLIFPFIGVFYVGRTSIGNNRYKGQKLNAPFKWKYRKPHSCEAVADHFATNEFCYWHVVAEFETKEELKQAEKQLLIKLKTCEWLLNERRGTYTPQINQAKAIAAAHTPEAHAKRRASLAARTKPINYTTVPCPKCGRQLRQCNLAKHINACTP